MTIFAAGGITAGNAATAVQARFVALRRALVEVQQLYQWSSGVSQADLEGIGFSAGDANMVLTACADANALAMIHATGLPPASYPQPPEAYVYSASQALVITTSTAAMFANRGMI